MREQIEGRNAVLEAFRSGRSVDRVFLLDGCKDGPLNTIAREARKKDTIVQYVPRERLDQMSETGTHQGVIAQVAAYEYASVEDILDAARKRGSRRSCFCWTILRIPIIWERSSARRISQAPTGSSSPKDGRRA